MLVEKFIVEMLFGLIENKAVIVVWVSFCKANVSYVFVKQFINLRVFFNFTRYDERGLIGI
tara:strand:+ start:441 stop:623 length:183 start_codon:yes stop_codon:yes gene_type:complete